MKILYRGLTKNNQKLYRSLGFIEYGRLPQGLNYRGTLVDEISMYKIIE